MVPQCSVTGHSELRLIQESRRETWLYISAYKWILFFFFSFKLPLGVTYQQRWCDEIPHPMSNHKEERVRFRITMTKGASFIELFISVCTHTKGSPKFA